MNSKGDHMQQCYDPVYFDQVLSRSQQPSFTSSSSSTPPRLDDMTSKPSFIITNQAKPIQIPAQRPTPPRLDIQKSRNHPIEQVTPHVPLRRKRGESFQFRDVQWANRQGSMERQQVTSPIYSRVSSPARPGSSHKRKDNKEAGIFRRTSQTCRKIIGSKSRRSSIDTMEGVEGTSIPEEQGPAAPFQQQHKGLFDRIAHTKGMLSNLKVSRYDTPQPVHGASAQSSPIVPSQSPAPAPFEMQFPYFNPQMNTRAGAAARKAAAAINGSRMQQFTLPPSPDAYHEIREQNRCRLGSLSSAADSGADLCSSPTADVDMIDAAAPEYKLDPLAGLPIELNALIFSYLDAETLRACQKIGPWKDLASDSLIWRDEYLRRYEKENFVEPAPIQIGGVGVGRPNVKLQDWETMYNAREQINHNWSTGKGRAVYMAGHTDSVYCVQFDERKIITGSRDRTIRVWDINTNRCIKVIGGPAVRPVPGPRVLRTVDYPYFHHAEASVNGLPYGQQIYHVPSDYHSASILCLQYDDEILVTGSSDNDLIVWDIETYEPVQRLRQHQGGVLDVAFDAKHIVSCSKDCTIVVWDRKTLKPLRTLTGHNGPVNAVQLRGHLLVSASGDGVARLWDLNKFECIREFPAKERGLAAVEFSDDAKYVLAGGNDHVTYKFEVATGKEVLQYSGHTQLVRSLFLDTQNKRVVSGSYDLDLRVYDYESGKLITVFPEWTTSWMLAAKCDYRRIVSTSQDGRILMIDFGLGPDGQKIPGVDLLGGADPMVNAGLDRMYPKFSHPSLPKS